MLNPVIKITCTYEVSFELEPSNYTNEIDKILTTDEMIAIELQQFKENQELIQMFELDSYDVKIEEVK